MKSTDVVDVVFTVCGTQRRLVYGEALLRHILADGEAEQALTVEIPIGRPESAEVLKVVFADCPHLTLAELRRIAKQIPTMERVMGSDPGIYQDEP
jgi:hypothetical protein